MNTLDLAASKTTPRVLFHPDEHLLEISGQSYPENAFQFYQPLQTWLENWLSQTSQPLLVSFKLDYFNTSSSKCILDLLECLERLRPPAGANKVHWYYAEEDEDMRDSGEDFSLDLKLPFELLPYKP